ncbi:endonuclease VIII [Parabacteroides chinchillae]
MIELPEAYSKLLAGRRIDSAEGKGIFVDIKFNNNIFLSIFDGINMRYNESKTTIPTKYQMLITFDDNSFISFNTIMYGGIYAFSETLDNKYRTLSLESISPLSDAFNESYFDKLVSAEKKNITTKALLATEQRIPGVGNGVLQDILFNAAIHPKRKIWSFTDEEKQRLFRSIKATLQQMTDGGGRDTETDFFGNKGGYKSILSKNTYDLPCPRCGYGIVKEAYMGGSVYYCPECQKP